MKIFLTYSAELTLALPFCQLPTAINSAGINGQKQSVSIQNQHFIVGIIIIANIKGEMKQNKIQIQEEDTKIKFALYEAMTKQELIKELQKKDKQMKECREIYQHQIYNEIEKQSMYKEKLEEEICENERAVQGFSQITELVTAIINKFTNENQFRQTIKASGLLATDRFHQDQSLNNLTESENQDEDSELQSFSSFRGLEQIVKETSRMLQLLSHLADDILKSVRRNKSEAEIAEQAGTKKQLVELTIQKKNLQKVLAQAEEAKFRLMQSIGSSLSKKSIEELERMNRFEVIEHIRKLTYRIQELESDKSNIFAKSQRDKEVAFNKYQEMNKKVKQIQILNYHLLNKSSS